MTIELDGKSLDLEQLVAIAQGAKVSIAKAAKAKMLRSRETVEKLIAGGRTIYGVNTGFGALSTTRIPERDLKELQLNLIRSHAAGYGQLLSREQTRGMMALRANVLLNGCAGARFEVCAALVKLLNAGIHPSIPERGSVGASGDLAPLAHLALGLIGEGFAEYRGKTMPSLQALRRARLRPIQLEMKDGLSLINGTQAICSVGALALNQALKFTRIADISAALSGEARSANLDAYDARIHTARHHPGQRLSAKRILSLLQGSELCGKFSPITLVQDAYSFRCAPQVHGASIDALNYAKSVIEREMNAATDNPLVFGREILSGGNFHGQPLALALDFATMAAAELGSISERRSEQLNNPSLSGLPAFLTPNPGLNSGLMAAQYLAASLVNDSKILTMPASTDSIPTCANIEDHVSMGMTSALKFQRVIDNLFPIFAVELLSAAQARDLREAAKPSPKLDRVHKVIRQRVKTLVKDRIISVDIQRLVDLLRTDEILAAAKLGPEN